MIEIRYAKKEDYELILNIDSTISEKRWEGWVNCKQVVLAFENGRLAGWLEHSLFIERIPFVNRLYLFEQNQRHGIGTGLMKFWEFEMAQLGYKQLMLSTESTNTALEFYKRLGYDVLGDFDYFGEHNELILGKKINMSAGCHCKSSIDKMI